MIGDVVRLALRGKTRRKEQFIPDEGTGTAPLYQVF